MRRSWFALITAAIVVTAIAPAYAKPRPPSTPRLAVWVEASPAWAHEADDLIGLELFVENQGRAAINDVTVVLTAAGIQTINVPRIDSGELVTVTATPRSTSEFEEFATCPDDGCLLPIRAEAFYGGLTTEFSTTVSLEIYPPCGFVDGTAEVDGPCIWTPTEFGVWTVSVLPTSTHPTGVSVTVRDHIPGNWCTLEDGTGGIIGGKWKVGADPIEGQVFLPDSLGVLGEGVCYDGGIGGSGWFPVGNPDSFYLVAHGLVSVHR